MPPAELTCVDTSAWIEYLRGSPHPVVKQTRELVLAARVCLADVVVGELFQGVRHARERTIVEEIVETLPLLTGTVGTWKAAGHLSARLRAAGQTIHLIDCYLASLAQEHGVAVLTCDGHFTRLHAVLPHLMVHVVS